MLTVFMLLTDGPGQGGGIARYNLDLLQALALCPEVEQIHLLCRNGNPEATVPEKVERFVVCPGKITFARKALNMARTLPKTSLVFCGHVYMSPVALVIKRLTNVPFWLQLHGIDAWSRPSRLRAYACAQASLVTAVSRYTRRRFLGWCPLPDERAKVLPNTVNPMFQVQDRQPAHGGSLRLLTVGRLAAGEAYKGHDRIIRALPELKTQAPNCHYQIVGQGDDKPRLIALAADLGVSNSVEFLDSVSADALPKIYAQADVFVMPSTGEGFGITFLEAMASGLPALGMGVDGSVDPLADGTLGFIANESNLVETILAAARGPRGAALAAATLARFGQEKYRAHVAELVRSYLSGLTPISDIKGTLA